jgi:hypothetical protein
MTGIKRQQDLEELMVFAMETWRSAVDGFGG